MTVKPIPEGYHTITPYLVVQGATRIEDDSAEEMTRRATEQAKQQG